VIRSKCVLTLLAGIVLAGCVADRGPPLSKPMSKGEMLTALPGKTGIASQWYGGKFLPVVYLYFGPDGQLTRVVTLRAPGVDIGPQYGTWKIDDQGQMCMKWRNWTSFTGCFFGYEGLTEFDRPTVYTLKRKQYSTDRHAGFSTIPFHELNDGDTTGKAVKIDPELINKRPLD